MPEKVIELQEDQDAVGKQALSWKTQGAEKGKEAGNTWAYKDLGNYRL